MTTFRRTLLLSVALAAVAPQIHAVTPETLVATTVGADAPAVLSETGQAIFDELLAAGDSAQSLLAVYEAHGFGLIWDQAKISALEAAVAGAADHGLPAARYVDENLSSDDPVLRDIAASRVFLAYARDINSGVIVPSEADRDIVVTPRRPDPFALLEGMAMASDPADYLAALAPTHPDYAALLAEKKRLEALIAAGGWGETVPAGATLRPGDSDARIAGLRARLGAMDGRDYGADTGFDAALVDAVKAFQLRHGLNDDGVIGPKTLEALNAQPEDRLRQVLVNLERQRWLNFDRGDRHIYVNQAAFTVRVIEKDETIYESRVVIGQVRHKTQEFNDEMTHLVVNPTWHVPRSIATEEMLPKLKNDPNALGATMQIMTRNGTRVNPELVDFSQFTKGNFPFVVKQSPGSANALGRVKFMFPNQFNIYLHDTPAKSLFLKDVRAYSHGCVRVQKPFELAHVLLGAQTEDPVGEFERLLGNGRERRVDLETPVPVYLTYQSVWIDNFGTPQYRADVYGRDARVFDALSAAGVTLTPVEG